MAIGTIVAGSPVYGNNPATLTPVNPTHASGDLLMCVAFARSQAVSFTCGTGSGWDASPPLTDAGAGCSVGIFFNTANSAAEPNPVITFTGGAANVTGSAVVINIPGGTSTGANKSAAQANSSAQNIAFAINSPSIDNGNAIFAIGCKIDNNAEPGMAVISGTTAGVTFSETVEGSSALGADMSFVIDHAVSSSGSAYTAGTGGSVTVTGGAAATSLAFYVEIPAAVVVQNLTPALFTNTQAFHAPTVTRGAVGLTPSLFANTQTFHAPAIAAVLTATLYTNTQSFFAPAVVPGTTTLTPSLLTNGQTFPAAAVGRGAVTLAAPLYTNGQTFFALTVQPSATLTPGLLTNAQTFFGPVVAATYELTAALFTNTQTFFAPTVAGEQTLTPALFVNTQAFHTPAVSPGSVTLTPNLFTNSAAFFAPTVAQGAVLLPSLVTNTSSFLTATVAVGPVSLAPVLVTNGQQFFAPVAASAITLAPSLVANDNQFFAPLVSEGSGQAIAPPLVANLAVFFAGTVSLLIALPPGRIAVPGAVSRSARVPASGRVVSPSRRLA